MKFQRLAVLIICFAAVAFVFQVKHSLDSFWYMLIPISHESGATISSYAPISKPDFHFIGTVGTLFFYDFTPSDDSYRIGDIVKNASLFSDINPVMVPWQTCLPSAAWTKIDFDMISATPLRSLTDQSPNLYSMQAMLISNPLQMQTGDTSSSYAYSVEITMPPCLLGQPVNTIEEIITRQTPVFNIYNLNVLNDVIDSF